MHIHIGVTSEGKPVKITASGKLVFESIVKESLSRKGMDMIGIVDCASPGVIRDMKKMISDGELYPIPEGGLLHRDKLTVIPGAEIETVEGTGGVSHHVGFFPDVKSISAFSKIMSRYITNMDLSSQRASLTALELLNVVKATGGILMPAHVFTPYKSLYGNAGRRMGEIFGDYTCEISCVELGLSADTHIADHLEELREISFLSNSDAHSIPKIAREYNIIRMDKPSFREVHSCPSTDGQTGGLFANVGMDPRLGRLPQNLFASNVKKVQTDTPPVLTCCFCGAAGKRHCKGCL